MSTFKDFKTLAFMMHNAPRFWHTNNIAILASQDESSKRDYVDGIIAFSTFLLCLFGLWAVVMIYFKIRGIKNYGCMAGQVTLISTSRRDENEKATLYRRYHKIQNFFVLVTCGVIVSCSLFLKKGLPYLDQAAVDIKELTYDFRYTIVEGKDIATLTDQGLQEIRDSVLALSNATTNTNEYCQTPNGLDESSMTIYRDGILDNVKEIQEFFTTYDVDALKFNLNELLEKTYSVDKALDSYVSRDWIGRMFSMVIIVLTSFFMVYTVVHICSMGTYAAEAMVSYFVLPSFTLVLLIGWVITALFAAGSTMNAGM